MIHITRRHVARCAKAGKVSRDCPSKPPCPVHFRGTDGKGKEHPRQALIDPKTGIGVRDWARASALVLEMEAGTEPEPEPQPEPVETRTTIAAAVGHFLATKSGKSRDLQRKAKNLTGKFQTFMEAPPRNFRFMEEIKYHDLTDFCGTWTDKPGTKVKDLAIVNSFLRYCDRCDFTRKFIGEGLFKTMNFTVHKEPKDPFEPEELAKLFAITPQQLTDAYEYGRYKLEDADQTIVFALMQRYTGMDVSTLTFLPKSRVRADKVLTCREKNGSEVWTVVPKWVLERLMAAKHDSQQFFFWTGHGLRHSAASKWFERLRVYLNLAGLQHRTAHNFRHTFAVYHLLTGTPIQEVARLLGHGDVQTTIDSYSAWGPERQAKLERHQRLMWENDPLHRVMMGLPPLEEEAASVVEVIH